MKGTWCPHHPPLYILLGKNGERGVHPPFFSHRGVEANMLAGGAPTCSSLPQIQFRRAGKVPAAVVFACQETCGPHGRAYQVPGMSFDRIGNLGKSSTMKARLQEEVRLVEITQGTRVRYTEMGVFSAVAGNQ